MILSQFHPPLPSIRSILLINWLRQQNQEVQHCNTRAHRQVWSWASFIHLSSQASLAYCAASETAELCHNLHNHDCVGCVAVMSPGMGGMAPAWPLQHNMSIPQQKLPQNQTFFPAFKWGYLLLLDEHFICGNKALHLMRHVVSS
jgi:hypothetical protein